MAVEQFHAETILQEGVKVLVRSRSHAFYTDEEPRFGGKDEGINPLESLLGSLGACLSVVARLSAPNFNVELEGFRIEIEGDIDFEGFQGNPNVRPGFSDIRFTFHVDTPSDAKDVEKLIQHVEAVCPVKDTITNPVNVVLNAVNIQRSAA